MEFSQLNSLPAHVLLLFFVIMFCYYFFVFFSFKCIDAARDVWDTELTARAGESYNRAYGVWHFAIIRAFNILPMLFTLTD